MPLYHYTSKKRVRAIVNSQFIRASHEFGPHGRDAVMGNGVYFTDLPPRTSTDKILWNNYGDAADRIYQRDPHVVDAYIEIPCESVYYVCETLPEGRKVFLAPAEDGIDLQNIRYKWGYRN